MYYVFLLGKIISLSLPRTWAYGLAKGVASVYYLIAPGIRRQLTQNLEPVVGKAAAGKLVFPIISNFLYYLVDFLRYSRVDKKFIEKYVTVSGLEYIDQAVARGKGAISLSAHMGNYEMGAAIVALLGYDFSALAMAHRSQKVNQFFLAQRKKVGIHVFSPGAAVKKCFLLLRKGGIVAFVGDRLFGAEGINVSLFGRTTVLPRGFAFFALKTGAAIIPAFCMRERKKFYRLIFEEPIPFDDNTTEQEIVQKYAVILERYIKQYPDQWYIFEKYWKGEKESDSPPTLRSGST